MNQCEAICRAKAHGMRFKFGERCPDTRTEFVNGRHLCWVHKHAHLTGPSPNVFAGKPKS